MYTNGIIYSLKGELPNNNPLEGNTEVTTLEKPISMTFPNSYKDLDSGSCYIGIKETENDIWRYIPVDDSGEVNYNNTLRASNSNKSNNIQEVKIKLYRLGCWIGLFFFNAEKHKNLISVNESIASYLNAVFVKNKIYEEDLNINLLLKGLNLNKMKESDLRLRITYFNNLISPCVFKVNGNSYLHETIQNKSVGNGKYSHYIIINNLKFESRIGNQATIKLCLNIKGIEVSKFPPLFLIEIYNINDNKDYLPFIHSQDFNFETSQNVILSISSDENNIIESNKYILNPTFTLSSDYGFTNSKHREKIEKSISISNLDDNKLIFNWNSKFDSLKISFAEQLSPSSDYLLSMSDIENLDNLIINSFKPLSFSTTDLLYNYTVLHKQENLNGSYSTFETEKFEAKLGCEVAPKVKTYAGFVSPSIQKITIASSTNTIVYNYSRAKYNVVLNKGTGISNVSGNGSYKFGATVIASYTLLDGYQFDSWNGDYSVASFTMPAKNVTMTAKAKPINYNIIYDLNGGTLETTNPTTYNVTSATITLNNPIRTGYEFIGWTGSNGNKPQISLSIVKGSTGERSYNANYIPICYSITYTLNDGNVATANPKNYDITSATITLNNPTKDGYAFTGWSGTGLTGSDNLLVTIPHGSTENKEYTAHWATATYMLTIIKGTGISAIEGNGIYEYGSTVTASCTMLAGYEFASWSGDFTTDTFNMPANNATMTANARPIKYSITYDLASGTLETDNPSFYDVTSATITLNNPSREGYKFRGWSGTGIEEGTFSKSVTISTGSIGSKNYTANWLKNVYTFRICATETIELRHCPAGTFIMGSPENELGREDDEIQHQVTISKDFYMGTFEVTQGQYKAAIGNNPSLYSSVASGPVERVSRDEAIAFCNWMNANIASSSLPTGYKFDLPTEAQWEYACRAGTITVFYNGDDENNLETICWFRSNSNNTTHPVGSKGIPNAWGLYDMSGNVTEWCKDWYGDYPTTAVVDPTGVESSLYQALRGGSWLSESRGCRSADRIEYTGNGNDDVGFRLALVPIN
ncbi:MAG: SUMF1/EgtB/PvdO family nonheme iron enzyme [Candidatus Riflebacteria bacterium]|nr:SUMF1/EgtB/PvdO family nonheme iron enzyme [Candidatus Riflebacteria bacterium]